jgi:hypothetical protein
MSDPKKPIEEYPPGPGHPNTLDGFRDWCAYRREQETAYRARCEAASAAERAGRHV